MQQTTIPSDAEVLTQIEAFCDRHKMPMSTFGRLAISDGNLVANLKAKRSLTLKTGRKVLDFMATYSAPVQAERAA